MLLEKLPVLISQGVRSLASPSDDGVGTLPVMPVLPLIDLTCGLTYVPQGQVFDLKFVNLHLLVVYGPNLLLV